jgi:hypothetical protein
MPWNQPTSLLDTLLGNNDNFPDGSALSLAGGTPTVNPQAVIGNPTSIHSNGLVDDSFSLNGSNQSTALNIWNAYNDGDTANPLPAPSQLDIANGNYPFQYTSDLPEGVSIPSLPA